MFPYQQLAREVLDEAAKVIKPGITADEIDRVVHEVNNYRVKMKYYITKKGLTIRHLKCSAT